MIDLDKNIGIIIHKHRKLKCLSQEALASNSNVHRTYVSQLERGAKSPTLKTLNRIARALGVKLSILIIEAENIDD